MKIPNDAGGRLLCDILEDMRKCLKTTNFSYLNGLIEEAQYRANRMENVLERKQSLKYIEGQYTRLKKDMKDLEKKEKKLKTKIEELKKQEKKLK